MPSVKRIRASDETANASQATVTVLRAALATTIQVDTVAGIYAGSEGFYASMGTPHTFTDPVTGETITVISEATAVDFQGHIDTGNIIIDAISPGYTDAGSKVGDIVIIKPTTDWANNIFNVLNQSHNDDGTIKAAAVTYNPNISDYIQTGGIWSATSGLNAAMTALTLWQGGYQGTIAAVATRAFTASKDTYVDVLRTLSGFTNTFTLVYTEVANGAAAPALAANSIRLAKVVTSGTAVTSVVQIGLDAVNGNTFRNLSILNLLSNIFGSAVMSFANPGTGGGSMSYINLGGLKICWGQTAVQTINTNGMGVTFPTGFFSGITLPPVLNVSQIGGSWAQYASAANVSPTGFIFGVNGSGTNAAVSFIVIGY